jgi:hypothetical protein
MVGVAVGVGGRVVGMPVGIASVGVKGRMVGEAGLVVAVKAAGVTEASGTGCGEQAGTSARKAIERASLMGVREGIIRFT